MTSRTSVRLGLAFITSLILLGACANLPAPAGGYAAATPSDQSPDH
jgi:hypothetical protein